MRATELFASLFDSGSANFVACKEVYSVCDSTKDKSAPSSPTAASLQMIETMLRGEEISLGLKNVERVVSGTYIQQFRVTLEGEAD